jgi:hypothetical protein
MFLLLSGALTFVFISLLPFSKQAYRVIVYYYIHFTFMHIILIEYSG